MSALLYQTGLWFYAGKGGGRAKLHDAEHLLQQAPTLLSVQLAEIEYVPEVGVARLREPTRGWREMEGREIQAADAYLRLLLQNVP